MTTKDIMLDDDGDLLIENGDFVVDNSDQQHVLLIVNTYLGNWKQYPLVGVGIKRYLASSGQQNNLRRDISVQLEADGYAVDSVIVKNDFNYYIDATRIK